MAEELFLTPENIKISIKNFNQDYKNSKLSNNTTTSSSTTTPKTPKTPITPASGKKSSNNNKNRRRCGDEIEFIIPIQLNNKCNSTTNKLPKTPIKSTTVPIIIPTSAGQLKKSSSMIPLKTKLKLKHQQSDKILNNKIIRKINNLENQIPIKYQQQQQQQQQFIENSPIRKVHKISNNSILSPIMTTTSTTPTTTTSTSLPPAPPPSIETSSSKISVLSSSSILNDYNYECIRNLQSGQNNLLSLEKCNNDYFDINDDQSSTTTFNHFNYKNINNKNNDRTTTEEYDNDGDDDDDGEEGYDDEVINCSLDSTLNIDLNNFNNDDDGEDEVDDDDNYNDDGQCSSSSSSNNSHRHLYTTKSTIINNNELIKKSFCYCSKNDDSCITLKDILNVFNAPISEDQAWSLIFQCVKLYRDSIKLKKLHFKDLRIPNAINNLSLHNDGSVHINCNNKDEGSCTVTSQKKILMQIGRIIFNALDYNLQQDEECIMSGELEELISFMTFDEIDDEGIERDAEDCDEEKCINTKELDDIIETCIPRVKPSVPEDHYKAVCRALVTEALELRIFLQKVFHGDTESLRIKADAVTSKQELDKLEFNDWARFWMQVVDELRRGVRLKKIDNSRTPVEYELTPYEILMGDIREKKYNLRKVMVNGDIPPRVKKDAHAVILEFIRSRPPLKKASERKLQPPMAISPSPREKLMDSIRQGRSLKPIEKPITLKNRLVPPSSVQQIESLKREKRDEKIIKSIDVHNQSPKTKQRLIKVDFSLLRDESDDLLDEESGNNITSQSICSQPIMPAYPITGYNNENNPNNINRVMKRTTYDLATQCESRRASMRRHTIVGCQSHLKNETHSVPPSRPDSRQSNNDQHSKPPISSSTYNNSKKSQQNSSSHHQHQQQQHHNHHHHHPHQSFGQQQHNNNNNNSNNNNVNNNSSSSNTTSNLTTMETWMKNSLDEHQWSDKISDRLSLTLEEIVHIRSVMTKAELEGLPVGVHVKEDVERRKVCFLCLKTRFSIFGSWGIQCKLCQRTVCSKCYTKMRIPTEHFRNVPVVLLSPSLMGSPAGSSTPSPSHHYGVSSGGSGGGGNSNVVVGNSGHCINTTILDESFPKTLMERLLRSESDRKTRNTVGSAPSSPKNQRSNMSTPGSCAHIETSATAGHRTHLTDDTKLNHNNILLNVNSSNNKENNSLINGSTGGGSCAQNRQVAGIMSRSMEGPRSLPMQSPGRPHSNSSTLDRKNRFARAFTLSSSAHLATDQKDNLRGEMMAVCNDCRCLVLEIIRSSRQTRSSARNRALKNLTLDISPVYKD